MRLRLWLPVAASLAALAFAAPASASMLISIDKSTQRMTVEVDGIPRYVWSVSTGVQSYDTPDGEFTPFRMEKDHFSKEWDDAPMPYSIFFTKQGHAIHGSYHSSIGRPASHGCVRLQPKNAAVLFDLVKQEGMANTRVVLTGEIPTGGGVTVARRQRNNRPVYTADDLDNEQIAAAVSARQRLQARGWREYSDGQRYYYERPRAYVPRGYYGEPAPRGLLYGW